jgi:class 3 adenylate cyclase
MKSIYPFTFYRTRGIVWVCDLAKSSSYLNDNSSVDDIENFIPRLYYVSKLIVESYGGKFIKWTGDGFLAFFEFELDRHKEETSKIVFEAAWHLTFMSNVTQLGLKPNKKLKIRHGIAYEKDALLMKITSAPEIESLDIIGRAVVLAFRLSGIQADFLQ